jgi:mannitol-1-phosphate 5-dehydrogenase
MKAVMYGAGNIGRGFIGQIFSQSAYELCFIDVADSVIEALNREGRYPVRILSETSSEDIWIEKVRAINGNNKEAAAEAIASSDIMATAVGVRALPLIAPVIAAGLKKRFARDARALNIIICENLINANKVLEGLIKEHLNEKEQKSFDEAIGLVEASIGRMVPIQTVEMQDGNPLRICAEKYGFLPVDKAAFKGEIPFLAGMCPFDNFDFFIQRKLFIHNMGHAICAYLGMIRGDTFIYETVSHGSILFIAQNAMMESALALSRKYNMPLPDLHHYIQDLLLRFSNKALEDTCARVGADTVRKLGSKDRFIGALHCCEEQEINPVFISAGASAALYCHLEEKGVSQCRETAETVQDAEAVQAARNALKEVSCLEGAAAEKILSFYSLLISSYKNGGFEKLVESIIKTAFFEGQESGII